MDIAKNLSHNNFIKTLQQGLNEQDIYHIKENIYNLDFRVSKKFFRILIERNVLLKKEYSDLAILGIFSTLRETLFGLLIYITYLNNEINTKKNPIDISLLIKLYIQDILNIDEYYHHTIITIIQDLQADFNEIIRHWIEIDDNKDYLKIGANNRIQFI